MGDDRLVFSSKIDTWLLVVLLSGAAACVAAISYLWESRSGGSWWLIVLLGVGALLPVWLVLTTRYAMSASELFVRCGPFSWTIPIREIDSIESTSSALSSPALSLDRLRIRYDPRSLMISPEPRKAFIQQLEHRRQNAAG